MKFVPLLHCRDMREAVNFYSQLLGFELCDGDSVDDVVTGLYRGQAVLQLSTIDGRPNTAVNVIVEDVDATWAELRGRGFVRPDRPESPVHQGPLDQTWGTREFYLDDPSGNTLRFRSWPK